MLLLFSHFISLGNNRDPEIFSGPVPSWVKPIDFSVSSSPDDKTIDGGFYYKIYEKQYNLEKEAVYYRIVQQITSEAGVQNASQVAITFSPEYQHLLLHHISVIRDEQSINELHLPEIRLIRNESELQKFVYSGLYTAYLNLNDVRPGDQIELEYTLVGMNPVLDHQFGDILYFNSQTPISHLYVSVITPKDHPVYYKLFNGADRPQSGEWNGDLIYEWKQTGRPPYIPEVNEPSWFYGAPYVQVTTSQHWNDVIKWAMKDMERATVQSSPAIQNLAVKWTKEAGDSDLYFIKLATRFVQDQIRYMGVEMGPYSHLPHHPDEVLNQRFGDCKDKSLLLCTFLRLRHIKCAVAFVSTTEGKQLENYLPSVNLFNHAIVTFEYKNNRGWIDPTISYQRGNMFNIATPDYGYAMVIDSGEDKLIHMAVNSPGITEIQERFKLPSSLNEKGVLTVKSVYTGSNADNIRGLFKMNSQSYVQKTYLDYYNQLYHHVTLMDSIKISDDSEEDKVIIKEKYAIHNIWQLTDSIQEIKQFAVYAKALENRLPVGMSDNRETPLSLMAPVNFNYRIQLVTPQEWNIKPADRIITNPDYYYSFGVSKLKDTINLDYIFQTYQDHIAADSVSVVANDMQQIKTDLEFYLTANGAIMQSKGKISWISVLIALLCIALFSGLGSVLYRYSPSGSRGNRMEGKPISGWLILVGISLLFIPMQMLYSIIHAGFFTQSLWLAAWSYPHPGLMWLVVIELIGNLFSLVYSVFILVLFFKRIDIFPAAFIFICLFRIVFLSADFFISKMIIDNPSHHLPASIGGIILYSCIWIPYFLKSKRTKATFVYSYKKKQETGNENRVELISEQSFLEKDINSEPE